MTAGESEFELESIEIQLRELLRRLDEIDRKLGEAFDRINKALS